MNNIDIEASTVTHIQFFDCSYKVQTGVNESEEINAYSANIVVDDSFVIQLSGNNEEAHVASIPSSDECHWNDESLQDWVCENVSIGCVNEMLNRCGVENNFGYLYGHGDVA